MEFLSKDLIDSDRYFPRYFLNYNVTKSSIDGKEYIYVISEYFINEFKWGWLRLGKRYFNARMFQLEYDPFVAFLKKYNINTKIYTLSVDRIGELKIETIKVCVFRNRYEDLKKDFRDYLFSELYDEPNPGSLQQIQIENVNVHAEEVRLIHSILSPNPSIKWNVSLKINTIMLRPTIGDDFIVDFKKLKVRCFTDHPSELLREIVKEEKTKLFRRNTILPNDITNKVIQDAGYDSKFNEKMKQLKFEKQQKDAEKRAQEIERLHLLEQKQQEQEAREREQQEAREQREREARELRELTQKRIMQMNELKYFGAELLSEEKIEQLRKRAREQEEEEGSICVIT
jgi:flagellar biosynthesis GTPase FlhF